MTTDLDRVTTAFAIGRGACRNEGCGEPAPVLIVGDTHTATICASCQAVDDLGTPQRRRELLLDRARIPARLATWTLANYTTDEHTREAAAVAEHWLADYHASRDLPTGELAGSGLRRNLFLHGEVGTGKSALAAAIATRLCELEIAVRWIVPRDFLEMKRESYDGGPPVNLELFRHTPVVVLDDLGAERFTAWAAEQIETIVALRYDACLPTIVTANFAPSDLAAAIAGRDNTEATRANRIVSRLVGEATQHRFRGANRRLPNRTLRIAS